MSTDAQAILPASYTFTASDQGSHTFAVTLETAGNQSISVTDGSLSSQPSLVKVSAAATLTLSPGTLPTATAKNSLAVTIRATGRYGSYIFALAAGSTLPAGLSLTSGGLLSGTPTTAGSYTFTIVAKDATHSNLTGSFKYTLTVNPAITLGGLALKAATAGNAVSQQLTASGGSGKGHRFALAATSKLPAGLVLSSGEVLSGTPTVAGTYTFTAIATDSNGATGSQSYTLKVDSAIVFTTTTLPSAQVGKSFSQQLKATGGSGTGYAYQSTALPPGLKLSSAGLLSGTPTTAGTYTFTVTVTESNNGTCSEVLTLIVK
jgi:hypothetical protein